MFRLISISALFLWASAIWAHPHVFVDVSLRFVTGAEGRLTGVEVTWTYDDFYTLLLMEDRGLDPDGDGALTEAERAQLIGFDLEEWPDWFGGALFMHDKSGTLPLGRPHALSIEMRDGQLVSRHARSLPGVAPADLVVQVYDPSYYAAMTLTDDAVLPEGCVGSLTRADPDEAAQQAAALLGDRGEAAFEDTTIGILFADTLAVECTRS